MDAARSSLEFPPPAWNEPTAPARHGADDALVVAWILTTCVLVGLMVLSGLTPALREVLIEIALAASAGWGVLTVLTLRSRRRSSGSVRHAA